MDSGYAHRFGPRQWLVRKKTTSHGRSPDHVIVRYKIQLTLKKDKDNGHVASHVCLAT